MVANRDAYFDLDGSASSGDTDCALLQSLVGLTAADPGYDYHYDIDRVQDILLTLHVSPPRLVLRRQPRLVVSLLQALDNIRVIPRHVVLLAGVARQVEQHHPLRHVGRSAPVRVAAVLRGLAVSDGSGR
jgi:hypothetical protein